MQCPVKAWGSQEAHGRLLQAKADLVDAAQPHPWHKKTD